MLEKFNSYYRKNDLFGRSDKILLTVSGGKDSVFMTHLFLQERINVGIAHCNFKLRGDDADKDEQFVRDLANQYDIPFYTINFKTRDYADENRISIQMAARELRYNWFEQIRKENNYRYTATAHHKNDVAETMLFNLIKGTGLAGLHGIKNKNGNIIRPLLCFNSADIDGYLKENNISFREDLSNSDTKYARNAIRHTIIPKLEKINPALVETLNTTANQFLDDEKIIADKITEEIKRLFVKEGDGFKIKIEALKKLNPLKSYLFYFLRDVGFNSSDVSDIINSFDNQSGKTFYSSTHQIVKDREYLILNEIGTNSIKNVEINSIEDFPFGYELKCSTDDFNIKKLAQYAYLDADKIQFPMILRTWEKGDTFQPFGMKGLKKVSDFLIDNKVSVFDKRSVRVLELNGEILWVVGKRIDDKFKITSSTKRVLILSVDN